MTVAELLTVKRWLESLGWTPTAAARHGKKPSVAGEKKRLVDKIEALLADARRPWGYLLDRGDKPKSMLESLTKDDKQKIEFCTAGLCAVLVIRPVAGILPARVLARCWRDDFSESPCALMFFNAD